MITGNRISPRSGSLVEVAKIQRGIYPRSERRNHLGDSRELVTVVPGRNLKAPDIDVLATSNGRFSSPNRLGWIIETS